MNILSTYPKKRKRKVVAGFMGTPIPKSIADYVTLYCNALEVTKMSIMNDLLKKWMSKMLKDHSIESLQKTIASNAYSVWTTMEGKSFDTFLSMLQFELKKKKLPVEIIGTILNLVKDEKNKNG